LRMALVSHDQTTGTQSSRICFRRVMVLLLSHNRG
jgi:hypothetical protein